MERLNIDHEIRTVHEILLNMLKWFHDFCIDNNLNYYVIGGTMLGAIRHKGFIPWDDDIDVGMPRRDYDEFIRLTSKEKNGRYIVEIADRDKKDFHYTYAKIYDTQTTLIEKARYEIKRGVYIDLFPLDGIGNSEVEARKNYKIILRKRNILLTMVCAINSKRSIYKNAAIIVGRLIPRFIFKPYNIIQSIDNLCRKHDFYNCSIVGNLVGNWGYREVMKREFFGRPTEYKFENITVLGVENPDEYLKCLYGDYMKLPPEEKRVSNHDYIYRNLNESYLG